MKLYHPAVQGETFDGTWQPRDKQYAIKFLSVFLNKVHTTPFANGAKKILTADVYASVVDPASPDALKLRADLSNVVAKIMEPCIVGAFVAKRLPNMDSSSRSRTPTTRRGRPQAPLREVVKQAIIRHREA